VLKFRLALTTSMDRFTQVLGFGSVLAVARADEPADIVLSDSGALSDASPLDELKVYLRP